jgi:protein translocase SecG subunit
MITLLCILLALVTFLMGMAILLQEPKQSGLSGSFGMGGDQMLGAGSPNPLSKFTGILAGVFLVLCLGIGLLEQKRMTDTAIEERAEDASGVPPAVGSTDELGGDATTPPMPPPPGTTGTAPSAPPPAPAEGSGSGG